MDLLFAAYVNRLERRRCASSTLKNMRRTAVLFEQSGLDPMRATDAEIEEWLASLPMSLRTRRLHFENVSAVYRYALRRGVIPANPLDYVKLEQAPDVEPRILSSDELRTILARAWSSQDELLLNLFVWTGMRRDEVRRLTWEDVTPTSIKVIGKGGKLRHVPVHPALSEILQSVEHNGGLVLHGARKTTPLTDAGMHYRLKKLAGEIPARFHDFRRTVATSLVENGVQEHLVDRIMGWAPRTVGRRYYIRAADSRLQEAILRLYADDPLFS